MPVKLLIGADPELFIRDKSTKQIISAHNLLPGTKWEPHKVNQGAIQVDGVAAEFNIDPCQNLENWTFNISSVMQTLQKTLGDKYELVSEPTNTFAWDYFKTLPENVRELGCNPDFNAWTGRVNERPDGGSTTMRTCAGHIHIGWGKNMDSQDETHFEDCRVIARNLDYWLGLYSLQWDINTDRRKLYGKAGSFRPKPYGMEYRPLSNVWLRTQGLQNWVFNAAKIGTEKLIDKGYKLEDEFGAMARDFIDNSESWWKEEDMKKSKEHKELFTKLSKMTGMRHPPPLPLPKSETDAKVVGSAKSKLKAESSKSISSMNPAEFQSFLAAVTA